MTWQIKYKLLLQSVFHYLDNNQKKQSNLNKFVQSTSNHCVLNMRKMVEFDKQQKNHQDL